MMNNKRQPRESLNKAFRKVKPHRDDIEKFKNNLIRLLNHINEAESEEFHKNLVSQFLRDTYYGNNHFINTQGRNDLVIHNGKDSQSSVGVILEAKKPTNKTEMLKVDNLNTKAFQELVLYFLRDRILGKNLEIKYLIATNIYEWFIFDAGVFEILFAQNNVLVKQFIDFTEARLTSKKTDFFYQEIANPAIEAIKNQITFTYFDIRDYEEALRSPTNSDDNQLIALFKLFSPEHLLKLPFANDSNSLEQTFYSELLHIIGLTETKESGKKLIGRKLEGSRHPGALIENAIIQLDRLDKISRLEKPEQFGDTEPEKLFNVGLELAITWINRILFLKLLEAQLIKYHKGDKSFVFLSLEKVRNYADLDRLFFDVLARKISERSPEVKQIFVNVPYLNSSLFEPTEIEQLTIVISNLRDGKLPIFSSTVLKDSKGKKRTGELNALEYLFEFLNAYDFSSEGAEEIQEDNKRLINAAVLGLIFEKINGYKDGSFFTPGFITMYMCRETIRRAVLQKFKEFKGWECQNIDELYDKIKDKKEANQIINSLKICDPAVGSGHFLVSALNEIIAIKSELKILINREGKTLRDYQVEIANDELIITDDDGRLFEYNPKSQESQRIQETLFHEKQTIIENCLFGVDINPNSVKICRLRLWIELLKNAYYKIDTPQPPLARGTRENQPLARGARENQPLARGARENQPLARGARENELETLPNIDINIKCGNSLISRFALDSNLKVALNKSNTNIEDYRQAVRSYHNAENKVQKRAIEKLIKDIKQSFSITLTGQDINKTKLRNLEGERYQLENQTFLFEESVKEKKAREKKITKLNNEIDKLTSEIEDIASGKLYENAFEWRFEFPEVLNNDGDFVGFDVVIGNPPYIRQEEFSALKPQLQRRFKIYNSIADLLTYFVELSFNILKINGVFQFIISNKFARANYGKEMRCFLLENTTLTYFIDLSGLPVFDDATVDAVVFGFIKNLSADNQLLYANFNKNGFRESAFLEYLQIIKQYFPQNSLTENSWGFETSEVLRIKQKVEAQGTPLKDWNITINYGIKTGYNEAFIIDDNKRKELIEKDPKCAEIIKPLLRGRDIQKYYSNYQDLWLIYLPWHFPLHKDSTIQGASLKAEEEFEKKYNVIFNHLWQYKKELSSRNQAETGIRYEWYALQRFGSNYWQDFEKPKIIYPNMTKFLPFVIDLQDKYYHNDKSFHLIGERIFWLGAFLNSKLFKYCFRENFPELLGGTRELRKVFFDKIAVKQVTEEQEKPFKQLVTQILNTKKSAQNTDTSALEKEIDQLVYQLYDLTEEEIAIIEGETED